MKSDLQLWQIANRHVTLDVQSLGGMIGPARVNLNGRDVSPLAVAPWADEAEAADLPPILQRLRGEWPCVPFGITRPMADFSAHWQASDTRLDAVIDNRIPHGYSSNRHWHCTAQGSDWIELAIDYPGESPIRCLRRRIALAPNEARIVLTLDIETRAACTLPIGLHPVFALSHGVRQCELRPGAYRSGRTYPLQFESSSQLAVDCSFANLSQIPQRDGGFADLTRLPLSGLREELVQLNGVDGRFTLVNYEQGYIAELVWNPEHFPSCILWVSNRGRDTYPWNNRHLALGIEPTSSFFDLNPSIAADTASSPDKQAAPLHDFVAGGFWSTAYSMSFKAIGD